MMQRLRWTLRYYRAARVMGYRRRNALRLAWLIPRMEFRVWGQCGGPPRDVVARMWSGGS